MRTTLKRLALMVLGAYLCTSDSFAQATQTRHIEGPFETVISRRGNPLDEPYAVAGKLSFDIDQNGGFSGQITKGQDENGNPAPALLFSGTMLRNRPIRRSTRNATRKR
jgi:hypothetical protein